VQFLLCCNRNTQVTITTALAQAHGKQTEHFVNTTYKHVSMDPFCGSSVVDNHNFQIQLQKYNTFKQQYHYQTDIALVP
jgi:hypothetical protein